MASLLAGLDLSRLLAPAGYTPAANMPPLALGAMSPANQVPASPASGPPPGAPPPGAAPPDGGSPGGMSLLDPSMLSSLSSGPDTTDSTPLSRISLLRDTPANAPPDQSSADQPDQPQGFLSRLTATDPQSGLTFRDKLMALGQIMQGDTKGAQSYLQNQRANYLQQRQVALKLAISQAQSAAFRKAYTNGRFDPAVYAANLPGAAFDADDLTKIYTGLDPKKQLVPLRTGGAVPWDPSLGEAGAPIGVPPEKQPTGVWINPVTNAREADPAQVSFQQQVASAKGEQARETKAEVPGKAPGAGSKLATPAQMAALKAEIARRNGTVTP
jgi:hypothetical protein